MTYPRLFLSNASNAARALSRAAAGPRSRASAESPGSRNARKCLSSTSPLGHASLIRASSAGVGLRPTREMNAHLRSCLFSHPLSPESKALKLAATRAFTSASPDVLVPPFLSRSPGCRSPGKGREGTAVDMSTRVRGDAALYRFDTSGAGSNPGRFGGGMWCRGVVVSWCRGAPDPLETDEADPPGSARRAAGKSRQDTNLRRHRHSQRARGAAKAVCTSPR